MERIPIHEEKSCDCKISSESLFLFNILIFWAVGFHSFSRIKKWMTTREITYNTLNKVCNTYFRKTITTQNVLHPKCGCEPKVASHHGKTWLAAPGEIRGYPFAPHGLRRVAGLGSAWLHNGQPGTGPCSLLMRWLMWTSCSIHTLHNDNPSRHNNCCTLLHRQDEGSGLWSGYVSNYNWPQKMWCVFQAQVSKTRKGMWHLIQDSKTHFRGSFCLLALSL